jgi:hypothetical protein
VDASDSGEQEGTEKPHGTPVNTGGTLGLILRLFQRESEEEAGKTDSLVSK